MNIEISIDKLYNTYKLISVCNFTKMSGEGKLKMWRILKAFKPINDKFNNEILIAVEKFIPFEDYDQRLERCLLYETMINQGITKNLPITKEEYDIFINTYKNYNDLVDKAIADYRKNNYNIDIELLSEEEYGNLIASNDWNAELIMLLGEVLVLNTKNNTTELVDAVGIETE